MLKKTRTGTSLGAVTRTGTGMRTGTENRKGIRTKMVMVTVTRTGTIPRSGTRMKLERKRNVLVTGIEWKETGQERKFSR